MDEAHDGAESDHSLGDARQSFMIDQQTTTEPPGAKRLLHAPSLWQQDKALGEVWASDDLNQDVQARQRRLEPPHIGAVSGREDDPGEERTHTANQTPDRPAQRTRGPAACPGGERLTRT